MSRKKKSERRIEILMLVTMGVTAFCCVLIIIAIGISKGGFAAPVEISEFASGSEYTGISQEETYLEIASADEVNETPLVLQIEIEDDTEEMFSETADNGIESPSAAEESSHSFSKFIFVGDSRYVGMSIYAEPEDVFIAEVGQGYSYFMQQLGTIKSMCTSDTAVIIGLGVNDMSGDFSGAYTAAINQLANEVPGKIYFMLVNPVNEDKESANGYHITNSSIDIFNGRMRAGLSSRVGVIDTNGFLKEYGFSTTDGLHYDNETYRKIYQYIKAYVLYS